MQKKVKELLNSFTDSFKYVLKSNMQTIFLRHELLYCFLILLIRHTAVNRTNRSTLRLFMKTLAFGTLIWYNVIGVVADGGIALISIYDGSIQKSKVSLDGCTV